MQSAITVGIGAGLIFFATGDYLSWMQQLVLVLGIAMIHCGVGDRTASNAGCSNSTAQPEADAQQPDAEQLGKG